MQTDDRRTEHRTISASRRYYPVRSAKKFVVPGATDVSHHAANDCVRYEVPLRHATDGPITEQNAVVNDNNDSQRRRHHVVRSSICIERNSTSLRPADLRKTSGHEENHVDEKASCLHDEFSERVRPATRPEVSRRLHWATSLSSLADLAFRRAKVRSKYRVKPKSEAISPSLKRRSKSEVTAQRKGSAKG